MSRASSRCASVAARCSSVSIASGTSLSWVHQKQQRRLLFEGVVVFVTRNVRPETVSLIMSLGGSVVGEDEGYSSAALLSKWSGDPAGQEDGVKGERETTPSGSKGGGRKRREDFSKWLSNARNVVLGEGQEGEEGEHCERPAIDVAVFAEGEYRYYSSANDDGNSQKERRCALLSATMRAYRIPTVLEEYVYLSQGSQCPLPLEGNPHYMLHDPALFSRVVFTTTTLADPGKCRRKGRDRALSAIKGSVIAVLRYYGAEYRADLTSQVNLVVYIPASLADAPAQSSSSSSRAAGAVTTAGVRKAIDTDLITSSHSLLEMEHSDKLIKAVELGIPCVPIKWIEHSVRCGVCQPLPPPPPHPPSSARRGVESGRGLDAEDGDSAENSMSAAAASGSHCDHHHLCSESSAGRAAEQCSSQESSSSGGAPAQVTSEAALKMLIAGTATLTPKDSGTPFLPLEWTENEDDSSRSSLDSLATTATSATAAAAATSTESVPRKEEAESDKGNAVVWAWKDAPNVVLIDKFRRKRRKPSLAGEQAQSTTPPQPPMKQRRQEPRSTTA